MLRQVRVSAGRRVSRPPRRWLSMRMSALLRDRALRLFQLLQLTVALSMPLHWDRPGTSWSSWVMVVSAAVSENSPLHEAASLRVKVAPSR